MGLLIKGQHENPRHEVILYPACIHVNNLLMYYSLQRVTFEKLGKGYMESLGSISYNYLTVFSLVLLVFMSLIIYANIFASVF